MTDLFIYATLVFHATILVWMWRMYRAQRDIYILLDIIFQHDWKKKKEE